MFGLSYRLESPLTSVENWPTFYQKRRSKFDPPQRQSAIGFVVGGSGFTPIFQAVALAAVSVAFSWSCCFFSNAAIWDSVRAKPSAAAFDEPCSIPEGKDKYGKEAILSV
jgi:hypothetical protein